MSLKNRVFNDAGESLISASGIVGRLVNSSATLSKDDIHSLRSAANQARQATQNLDMLLGILEAEYEK